MKPGSIPLFLGACLAGTGCLTMAHGRLQSVEVRSDPPGAVATAGDQMTTTPGELSLPRRSPADITISKPGCTSVVVKLQRRLGGSFWIAPVVLAGGGAAVAASPDRLSGLSQVVIGANVAAGALASLITDLATGAAYRLEPPQVSVRLDCP